MGSTRPSPEQKSLCLCAFSLPISEGTSPEPFLKKRRPQPYRGGESSGNALEASNALDYRVWEIRFEGNCRKHSESVSRVFPEFFRNFFRKVPAVLGVWPIFGFARRGKSLIFLRFSLAFSKRSRKALKPQPFPHTPPLPLPPTPLSLSLSLSLSLLQCFGMLRAAKLVWGRGPGVSGTESAILNSESCDSESCDSKVALSIDRMRFGWRFWIDFPLFYFTALRLDFWRPDPCSVDFGCEAPKFWFEFCRGFLGRFFPPVFSKEKGPKNPPKNPPQIHLRHCSERFPSDFCRNLLLTIFCFSQRNFSRDSGNRAIRDSVPLRSWGIKGGTFSPIAIGHKTITYLTFILRERQGGLEKRGGWKTSRMTPLPKKVVLFYVRKAPDTFTFVRHVMRASLSARPKCSHKCVSRKETLLKRVEILTHATRRSTEQTSMRTKWLNISRFKLLRRIS